MADFQNMEISITQKLKKVIIFVIQLGTAGIDPYIIMTENCTRYDGSVSYQLTGLFVENLKIATWEKEPDSSFHSPFLNIEIDFTLKFIFELDEGLSDLLTAIVPLTPINHCVVFIWRHNTLYTFECQVACSLSKSYSWKKRIFWQLSRCLSVWLTKGLVLLLTTAVCWCADIVPYRSVCNETHIYHSLSNCFHNAWAVFVGVSVPQQPTNSSRRVFFLCTSVFLSLLALFSKTS